MKEWALSIVAVLAACTARQGGKVFSNAEIQQFKNSIGYTEEPGGVDPNQGVALDWPSPLKLEALAGWQKTHDGISSRENGAARTWDLRKGAEELTIELFVSSAGPRPART